MVELYGRVKRVSRRFCFTFTLALRQKENIN